MRRWLVKTPANWLRSLRWPSCCRPIPTRPTGLPNSSIPSFARRSSPKRRAARIAAEGTRQEQQVGLRTTIDVLNAEQELRQAELTQVNSRHDEYVAAANVLATMGRLEGRNLVPTAPQYDAAKNFRKLRLT